MTRKRRVFSPEDRLSLLQEAEREGFSETCRKHNLSPALLSRWRKKYLAKGVEGLKPAYRGVDRQIRALDEESDSPKPIVATQPRELEVKTETLTKAPIQFKKKER